MSTQHYTTNGTAIDRRLSQIFNPAWVHWYLAYKRKTNFTDKEWDNSIIWC